MAEHFIGIDVAKKHLDVHCNPLGWARRIDNTSEAIAEMLKELKQLKPACIVVESTGGYERLLVAELHAADLPVAVVNPRQVRDFARASGKLAKTDRIDAEVLARFAELMQPRLTPVADETTEVIRSLVTRRRQLLELHRAESNRLEHSHDKKIVRSINAVMRVLQKQLAQMDHQLQEVIESSSIWKVKAELLESMPGIGKTTSAAIVAEMPELGSLNRRQVAALMGVAPINRDSGTLRGKRMTGGGRASLRKAMFMPTLVAIRHNARIREFYLHLLANGKAKMTAVIACMRKLLTILNAMLRDQRPWTPKTA